MGTGGRAGLVAVTPEKEINLIDFFTRAEKGRGNAEVRARKKDQESMDGHPALHSAGKQAAPTLSTLLYPSLFQNDVP